MNLVTRLALVGTLAAVSAIPCFAAAPAVIAVPTSPGTKLPASLGINLAGLTDWNSELPLVDLMKSSRQWISQQKGQPWGKGPQLAVDEKGWVTKLDPDCYIEVPMCTGLGPHIPSGQFVLLYDGKGTIVVNNCTIDSSAPGRIAFTPDKSKGEFWLRITAIDPTDYPKNIRVLLPGTEKTYKTDPFNPTFLARWKGVSTLRFMDWQDTNNTQVVHWADRTQPDDFSFAGGHKGVPVETMVDLANRLGADPWFCMPDQADDDYIRNFAALVKQKLDPKRKVYIEYSNEVWNSMFHQNKYAVQQGQVLNFGAKERPWEGGGNYYAHRSVQIFNIWSDVFGSHDRLVRLLAWQAGSTWWTDNIVLPFEDAYKSTDALAIAPYLTYLPSPGGKTLDSDVIAKGTADQVLDYVETVSLPDSVKWITGQKAVADKYHIQLIAYEGGQHLVGVGNAPNNDDLNKLLIAANSSPRMGAIYDKYFDAWRASGGGTFSYFSSVGKWSKWGSWGVIQNWDDDTAQSPKYQAIAHFAQACGKTLGTNPTTVASK